MSATVSLFISIGLVGSVLGVCPNVISRAEWGAAPGETTSLRAHPATHVVLHHSETPTCTNQDNCMAIVRSIQKNHIKWLRYTDIGYNFLIGEDGNVYEGVGWGKMGKDNTSLDRVSIGICMIGDFTSIMPSDKALTALRSLIGCGVERNHLSWDHRMVAHGQLKNTKCPGYKLYHHIRGWPNWSAYP
ncbi:PREDICTED: peptidoglycan recognition protein-like [Nicrophorus vespilloides]|uniref:Peptidoglycan-recognition protein n=1 Tax=Nicrophorus vespilloides TaxID=110193 RepID=A0ABM1NGJ8_NICVS|nr:PREDICTED: peptidoglycan recognition protein-like [Nicrophorus vespilloides]